MQLICCRKWLKSNETEWAQAANVDCRKNIWYDHEQGKFSLTCKYAFTCKWYFITFTLHQTLTFFLNKWLGGHDKKWELKTDIWEIRMCWMCKFILLEFLQCPHARLSASLNKHAVCKYRTQITGWDTTAKSVFFN